MINLRYAVTIDGKTIFQKEDGMWVVRQEAANCITKHITAPFDFQVALSGLAVKLPEPYKRDAAVLIINRFADSLCGDTQRLTQAKKGDKGSAEVGIIKVTWECTYSGRRPARPKHIIAAEKAKAAARVQARKEREDKELKDADQRTVNVRNRIKRQVDHAFALGKHGTEPAGMYITCQYCDAEASVICLNQPLARGASVVDEDAIIGALCAPHISAGAYNWYQTRAGRKNSDVTNVLCHRLEFFYDGIRQIAIKP